MGLTKYFEWITIIGASLILGVLSYVAAVYLYQIDFLGYNGNPAYEIITVEAGQFYWKFIYPNGTSSSILKIKAGNLYKLEMYSEDVIHSLFVPELGYKIDVFPNYKTTMWIKIDKPGTYNIYCAEYCGTFHYAMLSKIVVE